MTHGTSCSRRRALALLGGAVLLPPLTARLTPPCPLGSPSLPGGLDVATIVRLHLEQLARCGTVGAAGAARIGPGLLAAARHHPAPAGAGAAEAAFALMEQFGEFPRFRPCGGSQ